LLISRVETPKLLCLHHRSLMLGALPTHQGLCTANHSTNNRSATTNIILPQSPACCVN